MQVYQGDELAETFDYQLAIWTPYYLTLLTKPVLMSRRKIIMCSDEHCEGPILAHDDFLLISCHKKMG
jgi:hypothetical protein